MNPRIQVEHTVTEVITGLDLVRAQILIAQGHELHGPEVGMPPQDQVPRNGYAIQCRVTTEDPENKFTPDYGRILAYRSTGGFGIRLDGGMGYAGAVITPFYDSLLVKVTASAHDWDLARQRMDRALARVPHSRREDQHSVPRKRHQPPDLRRRPRHHHADRHHAGAVRVQAAPRPRHQAAELPRQRHRQRQPARQGLPAGKGLRARPAAGLRRTRPPSPRARATCCWNSGRRSSRSGRPSESACSSPTPPSATPTSRSWPRACAPTTCWPAPAPLARRLAHWTAACSRWKCGAAPPSTPRCASCREDPWERLRQLRAAIPNICFQMLFRGSNAVGYSNYPDNVVAGFVKHAAASGMDIFRIFDSLNYLPNLRVAMEAVQRDARHLRGGHLLHRRHPRRAPRQVFAEVLRPDWPGN